MTAGIAAGVGLLLGQFLPAYLSLDLFFRHMNLEPNGLRSRLKRYQLLYALMALGWCGAAAWGMWRLAGGAGLGMALLGWAPWWVLWRFGLRKQLTFLFKDDDGRPVEMPKPDPR